LAKDNIFYRVGRLVDNLSLLSRAEMRSSTSNFSGFANFFGLGLADPSVSEQSAMKIAAVYSCLNVLGETIGSLPFDVKQETAKGKRTAYEHKAYKLIHDKPNPYTNALDFWSSVEKLRKAWGNAYAEIERDRFGEPIALWLLMPWEVNVVMKDRQLYYQHNGKVISHTNILHFKGFTLNGYMGISAIRQNAITMGKGQKLAQYSSNNISDRPPGYLTAPFKPKDEGQIKNITEQWTGKKEDIGVTDIGGTKLLYGGIEYKAFTLPADEVQYIETEKLTRVDIYGIFRVPPTKAQDYNGATFSNAEQQSLVFKDAVVPATKSLEQECNDKLFRSDNYQSKEPFYTKFNFRGFLQSDLKTQKEFFQSMLTNGVYSPNMVLDLLDENPYEGGDKRYIQGAMVPVDLVETLIMKRGAKSTQKIEQKSLNDEQRSKLKSILNGHYNEVIDIIDPLK